MILSSAPFPISISLEYPDSCVSHPQAIYRSLSLGLCILGRSLWSICEAIAASMAYCAVDTSVKEVRHESHRDKLWDDNGDRSTGPQPGQ